MKFFDISLSFWILGVPELRINAFSTGGIFEKGEFLTQGPQTSSSGIMIRTAAKTKIPSALKIGMVLDSGILRFLYFH